MGVGVMQLPSLRLAGASQQMLQEFRGYNHNPRISEGEWYNEQNMMSEDYPVLSTRRKRRGLSELVSPAGCINKDALYVVEGSRIGVYSGGETLPYYVEMELSTAENMCPKQLISMGAYLLIWPDKKFLNTQDLSDKGSMEVSHSFSAGTTLTATICEADGTSAGIDQTGPTAPTEPATGDRWLDTSVAELPVLKEWTGEMWTTIPTTYVKFSTANIGSGLSQYDGITFSGLGGTLASFNSSYVIWARDNNWIVVPGILNTETVTYYVPSGETVTVARTVPDMDFVTESGNRIWGCKYGIVDGKPVNELYASALGDFKNWSRFMGLSTDSWSAGRGADGVYTGAITHQGHPLFFKENCIEKIYPSASGAHQVVTVEGRGVQKGCWRSLAIVGETLFYKSRTDVCAFTGSLPVSVSEALGDEQYSDARAGSIGELYYISMKDSDENWHMFTYDTARNIWHREDNMKAQMFAAHAGELFFINERDTPNVLMGCSGDDYAYEIDGPIWELESGVIGLDLAENEYISRFVIRCQTPGNVTLYIKYDEDDEWVQKGVYRGSGRLESFVLPVAPRRCDHLRYKLVGGKAIKIYSITKYVERGSDTMW